MARLRVRRVGRGVRMSGEKEAFIRNFKVVVSLVAGGTLGSLTLVVSKLSIISDNPLEGAVQRALIDLLFPGMIGAAAFSGNVHAWSLWTAAGINALIYFILGWIACSLLISLFRRRTTSPANRS